jgi:hypothetical protein
MHSKHDHDHQYLVIPFFSLPVVLGIELKASHLLDKHSTTWAMHPALYLVILLKKKLLVVTPSKNAKKTFWCGKKKVFTVFYTGHLYIKDMTCLCYSPGW